MAGARDAGFAGDVQQAAQTEEGVEVESRKILGGFPRTQLQGGIDGRPEIAKVAEEVAHAGLHQWRCDVLVHRGDGFEDGFVHRIVELGYTPVEGFERVARIGVRPRGAGAQHRGGQNQRAGVQGPTPARMLI